MEWKFHKDGTRPIDDSIFVFGSNLAGRHGAGAAKVARQYFRAQPGEGEGLTGRAFAIPTKGFHLEVLPLEHIKRGVSAFCEASHLLKAYRFFVTRVGCGLAGYRDEQIAPMFAAANFNCSFPDQWRQYLPPTARE